jgi:hypothetical protein
MTRWLDRRIASPGPHLALALSQREFDKALKHCGVLRGAEWLNAGADATAHFLVRKGGGVTAVVCLQVTDERNSIEIAGLLVHEAVHVWQEYADAIGEHRPGREQEAYAIQSIAQELMAEFARRTQTPEKAD